MGVTLVSHLVVARFRCCSDFRGRGRPPGRRSIDSSSLRSRGSWSFGRAFICESWARCRLLWACLEQLNKLGSARGVSPGPQPTFPIASCAEVQHGRLSTSHHASQQ